LKARIDSKRLSRDQLAQAQQELQTIVEGLPPDAREEYQRLQTARDSDKTASYRGTNPAFEGVAPLNEDFRRAHVAAAKPADNPSEAAPGSQTRRTVAVVAPEF
jgi:hypothetical protein